MFNCFLTAIKQKKGKVTSALQKNCLYITSIKSFPMYLRFPIHLFLYFGTYFRTYYPTKTHQSGNQLKFLDALKFLSAGDSNGAFERRKGGTISARSLLPAAPRTLHSLHLRGLHTRANPCWKLCIFAAARGKCSRKKRGAVKVRARFKLFVPACGHRKTAASAAGCTFDGDDVLERYQRQRQRWGRRSPRVTKRRMGRWVFMMQNEKFLLYFSRSDSYATPYFCDCLLTFYQ